MLFGRLTVNQTHIAFYYAATFDRRARWVKRATDNGSYGRKLPGVSPDGSQIAFSRQVGATGMRM